MNRDDLERFLLGERGKNGGQPPREHRLPRPGRADHQQRVAARGRDLECALRDVLADDVRQIDGLGRWRNGVIADDGAGWEQSAIADLRHGVRERRRRAERQSRHERRLRDVRRWQDQRDGGRCCATRAPRAHEAPGHRQRATNRPQHAVESELAHRDDGRQRLDIDLPGGGEEA